MTIDRARQHELLQLAKVGHRKALNDICVSMGGLVRRLGMSFVRFNPRVEMDDLMQEGLIAVVDAVRWFDHGRGYQFSTYAGDCIRRRMAKYLSKRSIQPFPQGAETIRGCSPLEAIAHDRRIRSSCPASSGPIDELLAVLDPRSRQVLLMCHGIGGSAVNLRTIGERLGIRLGLARALYRDGKRALRKRGRFREMP